MYKKVKGGEIIHIQGLDICIPPLGFGCHSETGELGPVDEIKRSDNPAEQYWERQPIPDDYEERAEQEAILAEEDPMYIDNDLEAIRQREWRRRMYGVWVWINGKPTYIPGTYYFFLNYWPMDTGHPDFRKIDLEYFYFWQYCVLDPKCYGLLEICKRRNGKCFGINTLIRMYDGSVKKVQDIKDGEYVMGDDSTPRLVYGSTSGIEEMFKVIPNKGEPFVCNGSHIIYAIETMSSKTGGITRKEVKFTANQYREFSESKKARLQIKRSGWELPSVTHKVDPYFLGVWLGDGSSKDLTICNQDEEIISYLKQYAKENDLKYHNYGPVSSNGIMLRHSLSRLNMRKSSMVVNGETVEFESKSALMKSIGKHPKTPYKTFSGYLSGTMSVDEEITRNRIWDEFNRLGVSNNKHIPSEYLVDSSENRLQLLAGLIDTDGTLVIKNGRPKHFSICFSNKYQRLVDDTIEMVRSLGFGISITKRADVNATVISIFGDIHRIPTLIKRKQAECVKRKYDSLLTGFSIEPIGPGVYYGFAVDDNHLFLLADGTVVHNTYRAAEVVYEATSRTHKALGGIQSKNQGDAQDVFDKAIVPQFQSLPSFFRPVWDDNLGSTPKGKLRFFRPSKKGKAAHKHLTGSELKSTIDYRDSKPKAYDGTKTFRLLLDESGKVECDVIKRHLVLKHCVMDNKRQIIGKLLITSTVEEIGVRYRFDELWYQSDPTQREQNGQTKSGLYRFFMPADRSGDYDIYGEPKQEETLAAIMNDRNSLRDSPADLIDAIRKEPLNADEAFKMANDACHFNQIKLNDRLSEIMPFRDSLTERGNFVWENGEKDTKVAWQKDRNGRWEICRAFMMKPEETNLVERRGTMFFPKNDFRFGAAVDPYDHNMTEDNRRSNGASLVKQKNNIGNHSDIFINAYVCKYLARPLTADILWEDMIKQCRYFGSSILVENNKRGIIRYFEDRGYGPFLQRLPGYKEAGIPSTEENKHTALFFVEEQVENHSDKLFFDDLINDLIKFDVTKTQKYDLAMACLWTEMACRARGVKAQPGNMKKITDYFPKRKIA